MNVCQQLPGEGPRCAAERRAAPRFARIALTGCLGFLGGAAVLAQDAAAPRIAIQPATTIIPQDASNPKTPGSGYFSDPYPIHLSPAVRASLPQLFSGTTKQALACPPVIQANCVDAADITVSPGPLEAEAQAAGSTITIAENNNIYQADNGTWHMATTFFVKNPAFPGVTHWNVIAHAHPLNPNFPSDWVADSVLVGSFSKPAKANYDGKFFVDAGKPYLIYSKRLSDNPARDGIVALPIESFTKAADVEPTILLKPDDADGGFNSELFFGLGSKNTFKLVETGNITEIDGKYALAYSTGAYDEVGYKTGVAWSDTFLPEPGAFYKKALRPDPTGIWGQLNHQEVQYLLQSQEAAWPNYVAGQVLAPGVPSLLQNRSGAWELFFAAYLPSDSPTLPKTGFFDPSHRRPFVVGLTVNIPRGATVSTTSNRELATWLTPVTQ